MTFLSKTKSEAGRLTVINVYNKLVIILQIAFDFCVRYSKLLSTDWFDSRGEQTKANVLSKASPCKTKTFTHRDQHNNRFTQFELQIIEKSSG